MAAAVTRLCYENYVLDADTALSASSSEQGHPVSWLRNHLLGKPWRSATGWVIVAGFNDKIYFNRGGAKTATLRAGTYATGAALAAEAVVAMEAADATPEWACAYSGSTFKFTISTAAHAFVLTCSNETTAAWRELGYTASGGSGADTGSALTHTAGSASYQSRHYIAFLRSVALLAVAQIAYGHNVSSSGVVKVHSGASVLAAVASAALGTLAGTSTRILFDALEVGYECYAFVVDDCQNADGFIEIAVAYNGLYKQPTYTYGQDNPRNSLTYSRVTKGASGAHFNVERAEAGSWGFTFHDSPDADLAILQALRDAAPPGKAWFFARDAVDNPTTRTTYGFIPPEAPISEMPTGTGLTDVSFGFEQILA